MKSSTWKSIGITVALTVGATVYGFMKPWLATSEMLQKQEADMRAKLPMKVDALTTLVNIRFERRSATYWYVMALPLGQELDRPVFEKDVRAKVCRNRLVRADIDQGVVYVYHYADEAGRSLDDLTVSTCT